MSTAAAPARKPNTGAGELAGLMTAMGSSKGFDPMPPDQYLYFLGKPEPPLQRLLALVRATTIRKGHRSAHCVDDHGKELRLADLRRRLDMDQGNFMRTVAEAKARGLIRVGSRNSPVEHPDGHRGHRKNGGASLHPNRVYLCGSVAESVGYKQGEEKGSVCTDLFLTPAQKEIVTGWSKERQDRFYADLERAVKYKRQLEAEAIALAREAGDRALDQVLTTHELPKKRLPKRREPQSHLLQLTLLDSAAAAGAENESVQTRSVQTSAKVPVQTENSESVPTAASLLTPEENRGAPPSSSSVAETTRKSDDDARVSSQNSQPGIFTEVRNWMRLFSQRAGRDLGDPDAYIVQRVIRGMNGAGLQHLARLLRRLQTKGLKPASSYGWIAAVVEEEFRDGLPGAETATVTAGA